MIWHLEPVVTPKGPMISVTKEHPGGRRVNFGKHTGEIHDVLVMIAGRLKPGDLVVSPEGWSAAPTSRTWAPEIQA